MPEPEDAISKNNQAGLAVIAGAGPGIGAHLARCFHDAGYRVALLARSASTLQALRRELPGSCGFRCDVSSPESVDRTFREIRSTLGPARVLVFNAGPIVFGDVETVTPGDFERAWRVSAYGGLLCSQQVIPDMKAAGGGSIVFIGATASRRGGGKFAAFAPAKAAQRSLAESMARHLWPLRIHVSLIVVDGWVGAPAEIDRSSRLQESAVDPRVVASTAVQLARQAPGGWSFEVDLRPAREQW